MPASDGYHRFAIIDPVPGLPSLDAVGHDRQAPGGGYRPVSVGRTQDYAAVQVTLSGCGMAWDRPGAEGLAIPCGRALVFATEDHRLRYGLPPDAAAPWEFAYINLAGATAKAMVRDLVAQRGHVLPLPVRHPVVREILHLAHLPGPMTLRLSAEAACATAGRVVAALLAPAEGGDHALVREAMALLDGDLGRSYPVSGIARRLGVSREHLTRVFARSAGMPPARWLAAQRLARAERLLADPRPSLAEVAERAGFPSVAALGRCIAASHGISPGGLRRRLAVDHNP